MFLKLTTAGMNSVGKNFRYPHNFLQVFSWFTLLFFSLDTLALAVPSIKVSASQSCVNSQVNVNGGQSIQFSATGQAGYGYDVNANPKTNPNGQRFVNGDYIGKKYDSGSIYPSAPIGALVGKIGSTGSYFFIGSKNQLVMPYSGTLFLCYNDSIFGDNTGGYTVTIYKM